MPLPALWTQFKASIGRLFRRAPPSPGRFETGTRGSWRGWVALAPWVLPRREYVVYVPPGHTRWRRSPMIVLLHGCRQSPEDILQGSRILALADRLRAVVLLPRQAPRANAWGCWNWFDRGTAAGRGETAIVAAQIRTVRRRHHVHRRRVFVAGMSSGAGLAAAVALHRPRLVAGAFLHSGVAVGAASSPATALQVLRNGPDTDVVALGHALREEATPPVLPVPAMIVHGGADPVVALRHAQALADQFVAFASPRDAAPAIAATSTLSPPAGGRVASVQEWRRDGRLVVRLAVVDGLAHAWSGGDGALPFNDSSPPDATALLGAFIQEVLGTQAKGWRWRSPA